MQSDRHARIAERAYQIWIEEGRVDGKHDKPWHRAEREVAAQEQGHSATAPGEADRAHGGKSAGRTNEKAAPTGERTKAAARNPRSGATKKPASRGGRKSVEGDQTC